MLVILSIGADRSAAAVSNGGTLGADWWLRVGAKNFVRSNDLLSFSNESSSIWDSS